MRIVCLSDTHNSNGGIAVPGGDILIHSGDATNNGTVEEVASFAEWFCALPHRRKIFVAGNHDRLFETDSARARTLLGGDVIYLQDSAVEIEGRRIYGSPWQPRFFDWAFNLERGPQMAEKWRMIPDDTDILITHGPPYGILDAVPRGEVIVRSGCEELAARVGELAAASLRLHIFGHIHCGYGQTEESGVRFVNASICDESYQPSHRPVVIDGF